MHILDLMKFTSARLGTHVRRLDARWAVLSEALAPDLRDDAWLQTVLTRGAAGLLPRVEPILLAVGHGPVYGLAPAGEHAYLIGPCFPDNPARYVYNLPEDRPMPAANRRAARCGLLDAAEYTLLFYPSDAPRRLTPLELLEHSCNQLPLPGPMTIQGEYAAGADSEQESMAEYRWERRVADALAQGDVVEYLRIRPPEPRRNAVYAAHPLRQAMDEGIVTVANACAAALRGGLSPAACYSLRDAAIADMEQCATPEAVRDIAATAELHCATLIREVRGLSFETGASQNRHILRCKNYIAAHLRQKLTVRQIADVIQLEPNYLSALFRHVEKLPLKQYILREKIALARHMVRNTSESFIEIADALGFSSQSHLGEQFRRFTGMTLRQYREQYGFN